MNILFINYRISYNLIFKLFNLNIGYTSPQTSPSPITDLDPVIQDYNPNLVDSPNSCK